MENKKILLTGGNGFVGSYLIKKLYSLNIQPILILRKDSDIARIENLKDLQVYSGDIKDSDFINKVFRESKPEIVIHLASSGVYTYTNKDNLKDIMDTNIIGTVNLINAAVEYGTQAFINTGSCFEYGSKNSSFNENEKPMPCNFYGITKVAGTLYVKNANSSSLSTLTLRPFTVFGPGEDKRRFISTVIGKCLRREEISIPGDVITRDYIYIDDVINGYLLAIESINELRGEIINLSTGIGSSLEKVANMIIDLTNTTNIHINTGSYPIRNGEVMTLVGSPEKAKKELKWKAKISLKEGLLKTINSENI